MREQQGRQGLACGACARRESPARRLRAAPAHVQEFFVRVLSLTHIHTTIYLCDLCEVNVKEAEAIVQNIIETHALLHTNNLSRNGETVNEDIYILSRIPVDVNNLSTIDGCPLSIVKTNDKLKTGAVDQTVEHEAKENINIDDFDDYERSTKLAKRIGKLPIRKKNSSEKRFQKVARNNTGQPRRKREKDDAKLTELQFELVHLSLEEQFRELEENKMSEKYLASKYRCKFCGLGFQTEDVHTNHMKRHNENFSPHKCTVCSMRFATHDVLIQHTLAHSRYFRCILCGYVARRPTHCNVHRAKCASVTMDEACGYCEKVFCHPYSLRQHIKLIHLPSSTYECNYCQKKFTSKHKLIVHMRSHTGEKPFDCHYCDRKFATKSNLKAHLPKHTTYDSRQHYCVECNSYFKSARSLKRHFEESIKHQKKDESLGFWCHLCSKQFVTEKRRAAHVRYIHQGLLDYKCSICSKGFSNSGNLCKHVKYVHENVKKIKDKICDVCGKGFTLKKTLEVHMHTHTGERPYKCEHCNAKFSQRSSKCKHAKLCALKMRATVTFH